VSIRGRQGQGHFVCGGLKGRETSAVNPAPPQDAETPELLFLDLGFCASGTRRAVTASLMDEHLLGGCSLALGFLQEIGKYIYIYI